MISSRTEFLAGLRAVAPILLGVVPFALITGIAAVEAKLPTGLAIASSILIFAGASQLAATQLIRENGAFVVIILTVLIINLRFAMYSVSLAPHFKRLASSWKGLLAYLLTDQAYALSIIRYNEIPQHPAKQWFYLGAAVGLWVTWQTGTIVGVLVGAQIPANWSLDFAIPLTFIAVTVPAIKGRRALIVATVSVLVAVTAAGLPYNLGLIVAGLGGVFTGIILEAI
ncbi:MAG: AzlC family ABC transporter permease [Anaerolineaceae bacterium]|nr:AzlC family ABC transporter permease [Anaerolineaceae bacterium]